MRWARLLGTLSSETHWLKLIRPKTKSFVESGPQVWVFRFVIWSIIVKHRCKSKTFGQFSYLFKGPEPAIVFTKRGPTINLIALGLSKYLKLSEPTVNVVKVSIVLFGAAKAEQDIKKRLYFLRTSDWEVHLD